MNVAKTKTAYSYILQQHDLKWLCFGLRGKKCNNYFATIYVICYWCYYSVISILERTYTILKF